MEFKENIGMEVEKYQTIDKCLPRQIGIIKCLIGGEIICPLRQRLVHLPLADVWMRMSNGAGMRWHYAVCLPCPAINVMRAWHAHCPECTRRNYAHRMD
ncbi:uncharacterized protein Dsimw501_GD28259 [Drosophila simulans]|uniref:Uncharacterized protein n=1 Tax=Drosophila simulans TaxID=7240 RepID=A0A0J9UBM6_DROSI|nr:uncharacterized protein Dsimw501_GD28259 [Drosophila simulans]